MSRPDMDLLEQWRTGDATAGNELFDRHFKALYRFFRNKVSEGIDDLVQKTFLACVEGRDRFREDATFRTYMFAAARNILYRRFEHDRRDADRFDGGVTSAHDIGPSPTGILAKKGEQRLLLEALRRIPLEYQIALELYHFEGMRGPEIAAVLDVPEATVRSRLRRGLEQLRKHLEALAESPDLLKSTTANLEDWAASLKNCVNP